MKARPRSPLDAVRGLTRDVFLPRYQPGAGLVGMTRSALLGYGVAGVALGLVLMPPGAEWFGRTLVVNGFEPQGEVFDWNPALVSLHLFADVFTALAYVAISCSFIYLAYKVGEDLPFLWSFVAFGLFIVACGMTHFVAAWTLWMPAYWLAGGVKFTTAVVSVATAVTVPPLVPRVLAIVEAARLSERRRREIEQANRELADLNARLTELDRLKTELFANVSHELRTPLGLILGPIEKLLADERLAPEQQRDLAVVRRNAQTLPRHVNDLLDVAKVEFGEMELAYARVDLARSVRLVASYFELLARERGIALLVDGPESLPADADPDKVERILLNVLSNAFKFTPDGGRVTCVVGTDGDCATIAVSDTGPGVLPRHRAAIFERFRQAEGGPTRRFEGTGLGLAIVKEFVELHGGTVAVGDAPGGGALFTVELPLAAPNGTPVAPAAEEGAGPVNAARADGTHPMVEELLPRDEAIADDRGAPSSAVGRPARAEDAGADERPLILVVEDNPEMRRHVAETLGPAYRVVTAADGREGFERALGLRPDAILSDVMMPGVSGDELLRRARAHPDLSEVPIVLLTARADAALRVEMLREGARDYVVKPFAAEELRARVANVVAIKRARDILRRELASRDDDIAALAAQLGMRNAELRRAVEARDEFLAVASHELRTPIAGLQGFAELAVRQLDRTGALDPARARLTLEAIGQQSNKLANLVKRVFDVSRIESGRLFLDRQETDLVALVADAVAAAQITTVKHVLAFDAPVELIADVDSVRSGQVVSNLIDNAIKYSPDGGPVDVALTRPSPGLVRLAVTDRGLGIPPERRAHIFDRFYQAHAEGPSSGLGLGLYVSAQIARLHDGTLEAEFPAEGGTRFVLTIPTGAGRAGSAVDEGPGSR